MEGKNKKKVKKKINSPFKQIKSYITFFNLFLKFF